MRTISKLTPLFIFLLIIFAVNTAFSQDKRKRPEASKRESERHKMHLRDSLLQSFNKSDTSINSLLQKIEQYTATFNQIYNNLSEGIDTADISTGMQPVLRRINRIDSLTNTHKSSTLRYLFVLRDNLDHIQGVLEGWQGDLEDIGTKLVQNQNELIKFAKDTSLNIVPGDSAVRMAFFAQRRSVKRLYRRTDSLNRADLLQLNLLQDKIAVAYTKTLDESDHIDAKIRRFAAKAIAGESDYLWKTKPQFDDFKTALRGTIRLNSILYNYFIKNGTYTHLIGFGFFLVMLSWIIYVRRRTLRRAENPDTVFEHAPYIHKLPFLSAFLIGTAVIPYFYDHPPVVFLESLFLVSMILSLVYIKRHFSPVCFRFLVFLFAVTIIYGASNLFIQITPIDRFVILLLSLASAIGGWAFMKNVKKAPDGHLSYTRVATRIFIIMQVLSVLLNISGRFSLAKIIGVTAAFNLWFALILYIVIQIILQALFLQFEVKRNANSFINYIDFKIVQKKFKQTLVLLAALVWLFFLAQNLNIDDWAADYLGDILSEPRTVGGSSFTFGGFVIFILVIWLSSILSRVISYFYDVSAQRVNDLSVAKKKNRTSALLIRLGVFSVGFLLAVAASGFPLEKLTIIISAFGVGIGFGLQNIVNNLVSGIILAFEKPIQIGDTIEVDNKQGTMKEIGIRSSKILISDGSEVIIPNGDLISQHVVNWTLSNNYRRAEIIVRIAYGSDIIKADEILKKILSSNTDIMQDPKPSVFLQSYSESSLDFRILFWVNGDDKLLTLKSNLTIQIYTEFAKNGVEIPSDRKDINLHFPDGVPALDKENIFRRGQ
ncbi:MAG TPA: mechanosensitive ion channel domain-containing protein [Mucilaginibacter sp.]